MSSPTGHLFNATGDAVPAADRVFAPREGLGVLMRDPWVAACMLLALALDVSRLAAAPFWFDETFSVLWVKLGWREMVMSVITDNHVPLYPLLLKAWSSVFGTSVAALRLPGVLFAVAMVPVVAAIGRNLGGVPAQRWAAMLTALSPYLLHHVQEARMYPLQGLLAAVATLMVLRYLSGRTTRLGWGFVVVHVLLMTTHYYGLFFVTGELLVLLALRPRPWSAWLPAAIGAAAATGAVLLVGVLFATRAAGSTYNLNLFVSPGLIWSMLFEYVLLPSSEELHQSGWRAAVGFFPVALVVESAVLVAAYAGLKNIPARQRLLLLAIILATVMGPYSLSLLLHLGVNPRYCMAGLPALLGLIATGASATGRGRLPGLSGALIGLTMVATAGMHLADPGHGREDVTAAATWLDQHVPPSTQILVTSEEMLRLATFHWPQRSFRLYPEQKSEVEESEADGVARALPFPPGADRVYYMFGRAWLTDPDGHLRDALEKHWRECEGTLVRGIRILCFVPPDLV